MEGFLGYNASFLRAGVGYIMLNNRTLGSSTVNPVDMTGNIMSVYGVLPLGTFLPLPFPMEIVARGDMVNDPSAANAATTTNRQEYTAGLSFKPAKGVTVVIDDQMINANTVAGGTTTAATNRVAIHSAFSF